MRPWWWVAAGLLGALFVLVGLNLDLFGLLERPAAGWVVAFTLPGYALLLLAWWRLGPGWERPRLTAALWGFPLFLALPMHSRDAYAYAAAGWHAARGVDPYRVPLGEAGQPGLLVGAHWTGTTSVYPSLQLDVFAVLSRLTGGDLFWTTVALRLPSVAALAILALVLPALARRMGVDERWALWAGWVNPVLLVQWIGGAHNDALMVALAMAALLAATDVGWRGWRGLVVGGVLLGLAMGIKQSAALFGLGLVAVAWAARLPGYGPVGAPPAEGRDARPVEPAATLVPGWSGWPRLAAAAVVPGAVTVGVFLLTSLSWGLGWRNPTAGSPAEAVSLAPLSWAAAGLRAAGVAGETVNALVTAVSAVLIVTGIAWVWVRLGPRGLSTRAAASRGAPLEERGDPLPFLAAVLAVACVAGPALQPWYATWLIPVVALCVVPRRAWLVGVAALLLLPALQDVLPPPLALLALAPLAFALRRPRAQISA